MEKNNFKYYVSIIFLSFFLISNQSIAQLADLQTNSPQTSYSTLIAGTQISAGAVVVNNGNAASTYAYLGFYLSTDAILSSDDIYLTNTSIDPLAAGASKYRFANVTIPLSTPAGIYYVIFKADNNETITESDESNNTSAVAITVREAYVDLTVSALSVVKSSLPADLYTTVTATITNIGTTSTTYSVIKYYLSTDQIFDASDALMGSSAGGSLAGAGVVKSNLIYAPSNAVPGSYFLIAVADAAKEVVEKNETNNTVSIPFTIIPTIIDFTATAPSTTLKAVQGYPVAISATITNIGNMYGYSGKFGYYLSNDAVFDAGDQLLGSVISATINPAATYTLSASVTLTSSTTPGSYYIIYYSDYQNVTVENDETNNYAAQPIVLDAPVIDLAVNTITFPSTVVQANPFNVYTSIVNTGNVSVTRTLAFYVSDDDVYDASDLLLASNLASGQAAVVNIPDAKTPGTYYILAYVDYTNTLVEANETNNVVALPITVTQRVADMKINSTTGSAVAAPGGTANLGGVLSNVGGNSSLQTALGFYLSADTIFDAADVLIGNSAAVTIALNATPTTSTAVTIPVNTVLGNYYIVYKIDYLDKIAETKETNNVAWKAITIADVYKLSTSGTKSITVCSGYIFDSGGIDYVYSSNESSTLTIYPGVAGNKIKLEFNKFSFSVDGYDYLKIYDGTSTAAPLRGTYTNSLNPGIVYATSTSGAITLVFASDINFELSGFGAAISCVATVPTRDLYIESATAPATNVAGTYMTFSSSTRNNGSLDASECQVDYLLSVDQLYDGSDINIGFTNSGALKAGMNYSSSLGIWYVLSTTAPGYYYILFYVDRYKLVAEYDETNNIVARPILILGPGMDLITTDASVPNEATAGGSITASAKITNAGIVATPVSNVGYYLSSNNTYESGDVFLGSSSMGTLASAGIIQNTATFSIPESTVAGNYYILTVADYDKQITEASETNNIAASQIKINPKPIVDLSISMLSAPSTTTIGSTINLGYKISNNGNTAAVASSTGFYLSENATFESGDLFLGSALDGSIGAAANTVKTTQVTLPSTVVDGSYYLIFISDYLHVNTEANTSNNLSSLPITLSTVIDLSLNHATAPSSALVAEDIVLHYTIQNTGTIAAPVSTTSFYLSTDNVLDVNDLLLGSNSEGIVVAGSTGISTITLSVPSSVASGNYYIIYVVDYLNLIVESDETNNHRNSSIFIGNYSDLSLSQVIAPSSALVTEDIVLEYTIENTGTFAAPVSTTSFYLSTDNVLDANDLLIGTKSEDIVAAASSSTSTVTLSVPSSVISGNYYIIYVADYLNLIVESDETNNQFISNSIFIGNYSDLIITVLTTPATVDMESEISVNYTIKNIGTAQSEITTTGFYLSENNTFESTDLLIGTDIMQEIVAGSEFPATINLTIPNSVTAGSYYLIAVADYMSNTTEIEKTNNYKIISVTLLDVSTAVRSKNYTLSVVYPNPATTELAVELTTNKTTTIRLISTSGVCVYEKLTVSENRIDIDTSELSKGVYMLQIQQDDKTEIKRIIIQ